MKPFMVLLLKSATLIFFAVYLGLDVLNIAKGFKADNLAGINPLSGGIEVVMMILEAMLGVGFLFVALIMFLYAVLSLRVLTGQAKTACSELNSSNNPIGEKA